MMVVTCAWPSQRWGTSSRTEEAKVQLSIAMWKPLAALDWLMSSMDFLRIFDGTYEPRSI